MSKNRGEKKRYAKNLQSISEQGMTSISGQFYVERFFSKRPGEITLIGSDGQQLDISKNQAKQLIEKKKLLSLRMPELKSEINKSDSANKEIKVNAQEKGSAVAVNQHTENQTEFNQLTDYRKSSEVKWTYDEVGNYGGFTSFKRTDNMKHENKTSQKENKKNSHKTEPKGRKESQKGNSKKKHKKQKDSKKNNDSQKLDKLRFYTINEGDDEETIRRKKLATDILLELASKPKMKAPSKIASTRTSLPKNYGPTPTTKPTGHNIRKQNNSAHLRASITKDTAPKKDKTITSSSPIKPEKSIDYQEFNPSDTIYLTKSDSPISFSIEHIHSRNLIKKDFKFRFSREDGNVEYMFSKDARFCEVCKKYYLPKFIFDFFMRKNLGLKPVFAYEVLDDDNKYAEGRRKYMQPISIEKSKNLVVPPKEHIIVVRRDMFPCLLHGHHVDSLRTDLPLIGTDGSLQFVTIEIQYCVNEGKFFMYENDFLSELYNRFAPSKILRTFVYEKKNWGMPVFSNFSLSQSPLSIAGYNVNQQSNLSSYERQTILDTVIRFGILPVSEVKNYLQYFISYHGSQKKNWMAKQKWEEDLDYLKHCYPGRYIGNWIGYETIKKNNK